MYPKIICFGDSLTQRGFDEDGSWLSMLANAYIRRADIINRGYSGYNSKWCLQVLPHILTHQKNDNVVLVTLFLGANDAVLPGERQHVPLPDYLNNIDLLIGLIRGCFPNASILCITPPPVIVDHWAAHRLKQGRHCDRTQEHTQKYASSLRQFCEERKLPVVDLIEEFGGISNSELEACFCDGLHFTRRGGSVLFNAVMRVIRDKLPHYLPENLHTYFPWHDQVDADNCSNIKP